MSNNIVKSFLLFATLLSALFILSGCATGSSIDWESRYYEMEDKYYSLLRDVEEIYYLCNDVFSNSFFVDIADNIDRNGLFPSYPTREDIEAILFCYIDGDPDVTRPKAHLALKAYRSYVNEMEKRFMRIDEILDPYFR